MIAFATRYDVRAQVASSVEADRLPAMCGSETFTTVVSSTSIKVPNITAMATIHGFTSGRPAGGEAVGTLADALMLRPLPGNHDWRDGHSGAQKMVRVLPL